MTDGGTNLEPRTCCSDGEKEDEAHRCRRGARGNKHRGISFDEQHVKEIIILPKKACHSRSVIASINKITAKGGVFCSCVITANTLPSKR